MTVTSLTDEQVAGGLKPCPFCGGAVKLMQSKTLGDRLLVIKCDEESSPCFGSGLGVYVIANQRAEAVAAWNNRAPSPELTDLRERLGSLTAETSSDLVKRLRGKVTVAGVHPLLSEAATTIERLTADVASLRNIVSECAAALPSGAFVSPEASIKFMSNLPEEIRMVCSGLTDERDEARKKAGKLHDYANMRDWQITDMTVSVTPEILDAPRELSVVNWEGRIHCAYLNDFRIAGGKPWGGGSTAKKWDTTLREVIRAFPELQKALGFDYLGQPVARTALHSSEKANG